MIKFFKLPVLVLAFITLTAGQLFAQSGSSEVPLEMKTGAQSIINGQFQAFRDRDHETAFSFASPSLQKIFGSTQRFIGMVKNGYSAIYDAQNWSFGRSRLEGDTIYQEVLVSGPDGRQWAALYQLNKEADGNWKIGSVRILPARTQST